MSVNIPVNSDAIIISGSGSVTGSFGGFTTLSSTTFTGLKTAIAKQIGPSSSAVLIFDSASLAPFITPTGSFNLNGINISITGSTPPTNTATTVFIASGSTPAATIGNIIASFNTSKSIAPYSASWVNITASMSSSTGLIFTAISGGNATNSYYLISGSTTLGFAGGEDAASLSSVVFAAGVNYPLIITSASISAGSVLFYY